MTISTTEQFIHQFKAYPAVASRSRKLSAESCVLYSYHVPLAMFIPHKKLFLVLAEPPADVRHAAYIAHHLRDTHNVFRYALRVPQLIPAVSTYEEIAIYHNKKLIAANTQNNDILRRLHEEQLRLLDEYFPEARGLPEALPSEDEIANAEAAGFISLPKPKPPLKDFRAVQTHTESYALLHSFIYMPDTDNMLRCNKLHKGLNSNTLFYGKQQILHYSKQSKRFYILADHNDKKVLTILREAHSILERTAKRRTVYIPSFDTKTPEENWRIYNRHLIGIARFITHYERDCSGARDTAMRFRTIHRAATRYFRLTNAPEPPFMPDDPLELAALRRYGAFREDKPDGAENT